MESNSLTLAYDILLRCNLRWPVEIIKSNETVAENITKCTRLNHLKKKIFLYYKRGQVRPMGYFIWGSLILQTGGHLTLS